MHSEPGKIIVTGIVVSAVAIAAYLAQYGKPWSSTDEFGSTRGEELVHHTRGDTVSGVVRSGPVVAHSDSGAATAGGLQAASKSLSRNDPAVAQTQPDVLRPMHKNDDPARTPAREVQVRADNEPRATPAVRVDKMPKPRLKPVRTSTSPVKHGRSHVSSTLASESAANRAARAARVAEDQRALDRLVAGLDRNGGPGGKPSVAAAPAVASQSSAVPAELKGVQSTSGPPPVTPSLPLVQQVAPRTPAVSLEPHAELTSQAPPPAAVQPVSSEGARIKSDGGPKTRAQVRSEIGRAREDGGLPAFGNPDPAGPAGAPSHANPARP